VKMSRAWAMPNSCTFSIKPIGEFVQRYLKDSTVSIDPFARNKTWATFTNDLNPDTEATCHMDAVEYGRFLVSGGVFCDLLILDPPYSPRQVSECYKSIGRECTMHDTQSSFWTNIKDAFHPLVQESGLVLTFGWNSNGMGKKRGYEIIEILPVAHGAAHADTICMADRKIIENKNLDSI